MTLELLLSHADDQSPALDEGLASPPVLAARPAAIRRRRDELDPDALADQRWGVVAPEGPSGDRLLALIEPLASARAEAQGAPVRIERVAPAMSAAATSQWIARVYGDEAAPEPPRYLLVLGEPHEIAWELQLQLGAHAFVGRLGFADASGYASYVDKALRAEGQAAREHPRALLCAVADGTAATSIARDELLARVLADARARRDEGAFAQEIVDLGEGARPSVAALLDHAGKATQAVLFSVSHGLGAPRSGWASCAQQRALQGAMSFGAGPRVSAADVVSRPFLPGGAWIFEASFGAGVPNESAHQRWLVERWREGDRRLASILAGLPRPGDRPFVAALPQALLAKTDGPLAVIAQVDLAWVRASADGARDRSAPHRAAFHALVAGARAGVAHHRMRAAGPGVGSRSGPGGTPCDDLARHVLLGDPAVRLAVPARVSVRPRRQAPPPVAAPRAIDAAAMQRAVLAIAAGEQEGAVAGRVGVTVDDLRRWADAYHEAGLSALARR